MQTLAIFANIRAAQAVSDYLDQNKIKNQLEQKEDGFHLFCLNDADVERAKTLLNEFVANPRDEKYWAASWDRNQVADLTGGQAKFEGLFKSVWQKTGLFTRALTGLILAIFIGQLFGYSQLLYHYLGFPAQLHTIEWQSLYKLVTPALMHGDMTHLVLNLFWWLWLGGQLEKIKGTGWLVNASLFSALVAHLSQYIMVNSAFIGLSGVVYGLLGYAWLAGRFGRLQQLNLPSGIIVMMLLWLVVGFSGALNLNMANWAHLGGLIAGLILAVVEAKWLQK